MNKFSITNQIRQLLLDDQQIRALVGDQIFPLIAPQGTQGDFILYQRDAYRRDHTKMGVSSDICSIYVNAISDNYDRSQQLAYLIDQALESDYYSAEMEIHLKDSTEDYTDGKFIQVLLFEIN